MLLGAHRAKQAERRAAIGKDADDVAHAADLRVGPLREGSTWGSCRSRDRSVSPDCPPNRTCESSIAEWYSANLAAVEAHRATVELDAEFADDRGRVGSSRGQHEGLPVAQPLVDQPGELPGGGHRGDVAAAPVSVAQLAEPMPATHALDGFDAGPAHQPPPLLSDVAAVDGGVRLAVAWGQPAQLASLVGSEQRVTSPTSATKTAARI